MKEAGKIAVKNQTEVLSATNVCKSDYVGDVVTKTDLAIGKLFERFCEKNFRHLDYFIVDEETVKKVKGDIFERISQTEWVFVIDPIDGTLPYATGFPLYGISVGVLKYGKPYAGMLYAPALGELLYATNQQVFSIKNAFTKKETEVEVKPDADAKMSAKRPFLLYDSWRIEFNEQANPLEDMPLNLYPSVVQLIYLATLPARGYYTLVALWDNAGAWKALDLLGIKIMDYDTGEIMDEVTSKFYTEELRDKNLRIICRPEDFAYLKKITIKNSRL